MTSISLNVSIPYALDYLSILEVKKNKNLSPDQFTKCYQELKLELYLDEIDINDIVKSPEYKHLYNINLKMFEALERHDLTGQEVKDLNRERFEAKKALGIAFNFDYNEAKS